MTLGTPSSPTVRHLTDFFRAIVADNLHRINFDHVNGVRVVFMPSNAYCIVKTPNIARLSYSVLCDLKGRHYE